MPTDSNPSVSIITPTYNRAGFLPEAISSVFAQTFTDFELIVLDDGSSDHTVSILKEWASKEPQRFRWTTHANMGQIKSVNKGFEMARGEYLFVLNSDDYLYPEGIQHLVEALRKHPDAVLSYGDWCVIDADGDLIAQTANSQLNPVQIVRDTITVGAGVLYTRRLVEKIGGWNPDYPIMPDFEFWLKALLQGPFVHTPHLAAVWRSHPDAITVANRGRTNAGQLIKLYDQFFSQTDLPEEFRVIESEAYRNLFFVCGLSMTDVFVPFDGRFSIFDRYSWKQDVTENRPKLEDELLAWRNHARRLEDLEAIRFKELADERAHSGRLEDLEAIRFKELSDERAHSGRLEAQSASYLEQLEIALNKIEHLTKELDDLNRISNTNGPTFKSVASMNWWRRKCRHD